MKQLFCISLIVLLSAGVFAETLILNQNVEQNAVVITSENFDSETPVMRVKSQIRDAVYETVKTPKGKFVRMLIPGFYVTRRFGEPQIPVANKIIEVPIGAKVRANVISYKEQEYSAEDLGIKHQIFPVQPPVCKQQKELEFHYKEAAYSKGYAKSDIVSLRELGTLRSYRLFMMQLKVSDYDAKNNRIKFFTDVEVELIFEDADMEQTKIVKKMYSSPPVDKVCVGVLKSDSMASLNRKNELRYLIISDAMFKNALQPFVDYQQSKGISCVVKYTDAIGKDKYKIRKAIEEEYTNPTDGVAPTFLLLVGDHQQIPGWDGTEGSYKTDLPYCAMGEADFLPDMLCGRFSAQKVADLTVQIDKTLAYAKGEFLDSSFLKKTLLVAGWDSYWAQKRGYPQIRYGTSNYFNDAKGIKAEVYLSNGSQQNVKNIVDAVNKGVGFFNYTAHGTETDFHDPKFTREDVNNLNNSGMYPVVVGNCCLTASFADYDSCFGETWLRAKNGAVGFIGGSSYTYWDEDLWWGVGFTPITSSIDNGNAPRKQDTGTGAYDTSFEKLQNYCNSGMMLAGNLAVQEANSYLTKYYFEVYHLFGDPGLESKWASK